MPITCVEPEYTSQECSSWGNVGARAGEGFVCQPCGHLRHAGANAMFNIPRRHDMGQFNATMSVLNGSNVAASVATLCTMYTANQGRSIEPIHL
ncbi:MAG: transposase [Candidatus Thermoplasmatota archaeon]|nr:transposase [Candidatus Thermoplasmatota archaeon]